MRLMNTTASVDYTLKSERREDGSPKDDATRFRLRCLTATESGAITDSLVDFGGLRVNMESADAPQVSGMSISMSTRTKNRVRLGVCGWDNMRDAEDNLVEFSKESFAIGGRSFEGFPEAVFDALPDEAIRELHDAIMGLSTLKASEGN